MSTAFGQVSSPVDGEFAQSRPAMRHAYIFVIVNEKGPIFRPALGVVHG